MTKINKYKINTLEIFFEQKDVNSAAYADVNTSQFCDSNLEVILNKLQLCALKLLEWFSNWMVINFGKYDFILSSHENEKIELTGMFIKNTQI